MADELTWVRDPEPGGGSHDVAAGICPGLVSIVFRVARQHICQCEAVTNQPHQHNGHNDLQTDRKSDRQTDRKTDTHTDR